MDLLLNIPIVFDAIVDHLCVEDLFAFHCVNKRLYCMVNAAYRDRLKRFLQNFDRNNPFTVGVDCQIRAMLSDEKTEKLKYVLMPCGVIDQGYSYLIWIMDGDFARLPLNVAHVLTEAAFIYGCVDQFEYLLKNDVPVSLRRLFYFRHEVQPKRYPPSGLRDDRLRKLKLFIQYINREKAKIKCLGDGLREYCDRDIMYLRKRKLEVQFEFTTCLARLPSVTCRPENQLVMNTSKIIQEKIGDLVFFECQIERMIQEVE